MGGFTHAFNPSKVKVQAGPALEEISGFSTDSICEFQFTADAVTVEIGVDGWGCWNIDPSRAGFVTISLMGNSPANAILQRVGILTIPYPVNMVDYSTKEKFAAICMLVKKPNVPKAKKIGERPWQFVFINGSSNVAGGLEI